MDSTFLVRLQHLGKGLRIPQAETAYFRQLHTNEINQN